MKIKYLTSLTAVAKSKLGKTYHGELIREGSLIKFDSNYPSFELNTCNAFTVEDIDSNGIIRIAYRKKWPILNKDVEVFYLSEDNPVLEIDNDLYYDEKVPGFHILLKAEYKEKEIDEKNLILKVTESARDDSGELYHYGEENDSYRCLEKLEFKTKLLKKPVNVKVENVDGVNVRISYGAIQAVINQYRYFGCRDHGGRQISRYDYESWDRYYKISLNLFSENERAIRFFDKRG